MSRVEPKQAGEPRKLARKAEASDRLLEAYKGGEEMPLGGYAMLLGAYAAIAAGVLSTARATDRKLPDRISAADILLFGIATHKLTRIVTRDWVTSPLRAPFTRYKESLGAGEVAEESRGTGLQRAVGDLLTCPYCTGPWVAGALFASLLFSPALARLTAALFASVALSDWLHNLYEAVKKLPELPPASGE